MRATTGLLATIAALAAILALSLSGSAPSALLETGTTHHVEATTPHGDLDLVAGMATTSTNLFGIETGHEPTTNGWILIAPQSATVPPEATLSVTEERPFEDPNGATWLSREVTLGDDTAWIVPLQEPRYDETLGTHYNFAAIIDTSHLDDDEPITVTVHPTLDLDTPR